MYLQYLAKERKRKEEKGNERKGKLLLRETIKLQYVLPTVKYCNELVTKKKKKPNALSIIGSFSQLRWGTQVRHILTNLGNAREMTVCTYLSTYIYTYNSEDNGKYTCIITHHLHRKTNSLSYLLTYLLTYIGLTCNEILFS